MDGLNLVGFLWVGWAAAVALLVVLFERERRHEDASDLAIGMLQAAAKYIEQDRAEIARLRSIIRSEGQHDLSCAVWDKGCTCKYGRGDDEA